MKNSNIQKGIPTSNSHILSTEAFYMSNQLDKISGVVVETPRKTDIHRGVVFIYLSATDDTAILLSVGQKSFYVRQLVDLQNWSMSELSKKEKMTTVYA